MKKFVALLAAAALLCVSALALAGCGDSSSSEYKQLDETLSSEHYAVGFKLGNENLANQVTLTLAEMEEDGFVEDLCSQYEDQGISYANWNSISTDGITVDEAALPTDFTLVVGFDAEYPPYGYVADDGSYTGFDLDLAQEVCNRNGWGFEAQAIDWDAKDALLNAGQISCIWNGFTYEGRETEYAWSACYMHNAQVVVVKADSDIATLDDLAGKAVQTQTGSAAEELLKADYADMVATFSDFSTVPAYTTAFMNLDSGACDAIACDLSVAAYYMAGGE